MKRFRIALAALAYAALVAHFLFIPYSFAPLAFDEAVRLFAQLPWLQLGSDQNVALASRGLMFAPLGLLVAMWVAPQPRQPMDVVALVAAGLLSCSWAIGVNFAQLWFPGRTVSLNNLAAEFVGVFGGALLWSTLGARALQWRLQLAAGGGAWLRAALSGYVILYLIASLTPFDFVTSTGELAEKTGSDLYGLWLAPVGCGAVPCEFKFAAVLFTALPCGWWFAARRRRAGHAWLAAVPIALAVATIIELLHFLMVSGVSQGSSVFLRASGMVLGAATYPWRRRLARVDLDLIGRPIVLALLLPYFAAIAYVGGWFVSRKLDVALGLQRLSDIVWMPFYYEYYAPYQSTMFSAMVHAVLYAPVGMLCWLWGRRRDQSRLWPAALVAVLIAIVAETSKVFLAGRLPDYTDVFIAAASATIVFAILRLASRPPRLPREVSPDTHANEVTSSRDADATIDCASGQTAVSLAVRLAGLLLIVIAAATVIGFPIEPWALAAGLVVYAAILVRFPTATYLIAIPLLLPVFDLAPFTGRFFWDEFDALLATTLGVRLLMAPPARRTEIKVPRAALGLLILSLIASTAIGIWPLAPIDANAFSSYLSPYNALRIVKGYAWAGALFWLITRDAAAGWEPGRPLTIGLALALLAATLSVFWEQLQFAGWPDLGTDFRSAGFVSATHVGGAYLEAMLVMLAPFGLGMAVCAKRLLHRVAWFVVVVLGSVALLLTLSRAGLVAWSIVLVVFALVWWRKSRSPHVESPSARWRWGTGIIFLGLLAFAVLGAQSSYLRERLAASRADFSQRSAHWIDTAHLMRLDTLHMLLGMGLGSFPRDFYLADGVALQLPAYRLSQDPGSETRYLVLTGGQGMYMDQRIAVNPGRGLRLSGEIRSPQKGSGLSISLCEKSLLNSVHCDGATVTADTTWHPFELRLKSPPDRGIRLAPAAPVVLSLSDGEFGSRVEVSRLSLVDDREELLSNGSFQRGLDRWFVTSDVHLAWRVLNTPLQVAYEQGALGLIAWLGLGVAAVSLLLRSTAARGATAAFASSTIGLLAVGCFDSVLDSPRITLLVGLIGAAGWSSMRRSAAAS